MTVLAFGTGGSCAGSLNNICNDLDSHKGARSGTEVGNGDFKKDRNSQKYLALLWDIFDTLALIMKFSHSIL